MLTPEQKEQILSLPIKWPMSVKHNVIKDSDGYIVSVVSYATPHIHAEFLAACLNAFHADPDKFTLNELNK